jgi:hypothetical protein
MINGNDRQALESILANTQYKSKDLLYTTEYREMYDGNKLYNRKTQLVFIYLGLRLMFLKDQMMRVNFGKVVKMLTMMLI